MVAIYNSIKPWINVPVQYKPFIKRNGAGTKQFDTIVSTKCYPVGDVKLITTADGSEVTSTTQLYMHGEESIKVTDNVIFNGEERPILRINDFYRKGIVDIRVVYL